MKNRIFATLLLLFSASVCLFAQKVPVSGRIVDDKGEPVIAAGVLIRGTTTGTVTDLDGKFTISLEEGQELEFTSVGYKSQFLKYKGQKTLDIVMETENIALNETIVVGYGTIKKKEMTSAISHVSAKDFNKVTSLDAKMLLMGKVSGLTVSNTAPGDPNQQASIQIRGLSSRNAGTGPLYVVDGVPGSDMTNINPEDIESIDVLKDGAASAIYGTRGGNGVIIVNLKKGERDGSLHTNYSGSFTVNVPKKELEMLNADQFRLYRTYNNPSLDLGGNTDWIDATPVSDISRTIH